MTAMASDGRLKMLRIEIDGHFHGGEPPRPWVARIDGTCARYGLQRQFIRPMNDWKNASKAWSGNTYGVVATFPLRDGHIYEVSRCRGSSSKRYVAREFQRLADGKMTKLDPLDALATVEAHRDDVTVLRLADDPDQRPVVAEVVGLGTPRPMGFVVVDGRRLYRLCHGRLYEVQERGSVRFVAGGSTAKALSQQEALQWLAAQQ